MEKKIYIYPGYDPTFQVLFSEIENTPNLKVYNKIYRNSCHYLHIKKLHKQHLLDWLWFRVARYRYVKDIEGVDDLGLGDIIIVSNISVYFFPISFLKILQKKGVYVIMIILDNLSTPFAVDAKTYMANFPFDSIYSFDLDDCKKNNLHHILTMYSKFEDIDDAVQIKYDGIFVGSNKGRYETVSKIKQTLSSCYLYINMIGITDTEKQAAMFDSNISVDYHDYLKQMLKSNCIIDVVANAKQTGLSLRICEAIVYNKKLLTNNPSIFHHPYYDPRYMRFFKNADDIDTEFVTKRIKVEYNYNGEFSPYMFINNIKKQFVR